MDTKTPIYKAELLFRPPLFHSAMRIAINGGCDLAQKCKGIGDTVAEQIQIQLPNHGTITAKWTPGKYTDGTAFTATFAGYEEKDIYFRIDNAHKRDELHMDICFNGQEEKRDWGLNLLDLKLINRRRVAVLILMRTLEKNIDRKIPIWFYMPWTIWWEHYSEFPDKLLENKPQGVLAADFCEAVMAYVSLRNESDGLVSSDQQIAKYSTDAIEEAVKYVSSIFQKHGEFEYKRIVLGHTIILPFPMYAPPGATLEGPDYFINPLVD